MADAIPMLTRGWRAGWEGTFASVPQQAKTCPTAAGWEKGPRGISLLGQHGGEGVWEKPRPQAKAGGGWPLPPGRSRAGEAPLGALRLPSPPSARMGGRCEVGSPSCHHLARSCEECSLGGGLRAHEWAWGRPHPSGGAATGRGGGPLPLAATHLALPHRSALPPHPS